VTTATEKTTGLAPLRNRDFRLLFIGFAIGQMLMPLQFFTQIFWVQQNAPRDVWLLLVSLIGASRGIGALTFGLYGGALADRMDRRKLLLITQSLLFLTTLAIAGLILFSDGSASAFMLFFAMTFLASGLQSIDAPTRLALVPDILGPKLTAAGLSLNQAAGQLSMPVALFASGLIIDALGFGGAYLLSSVGHVVVIIAIVLMSFPMTFGDRVRHRGAYGFGQAIRDVRYGLSYARNHPVILWIIILLATMMGFGFPATANLGPTWITTVVGVEIKYVGFVAMTWGIGAFLTAAAMARFSSFEHRGALIAVGTTLFSLAFVVFVIDHSVVNAVIGNFGLGAGMTMAMLSSTILIQHMVPNEVRGRIMSILQLNMGFAQLMTLPIAALGQWLTLQLLFPIMAFSALVMIVLILATHPEIMLARIPKTSF
jgi:MFS family permease|tara:strand:- start:7203 stop:8486 length:1284 start_codon:yes stop_codon:yes gene_type:complete